jgi:hypothetical protein
MQPMISIGIGNCADLSVKKFIYDAEIHALIDINNIARIIRSR